MRVKLACCQRPVSSTQSLASGTHEILRIAGASLETAPIRRAGMPLIAAGYPRSRYTPLAMSPLLLPVQLASRRLPVGSTAISWKLLSSESSVIGFASVSGQYACAFPR
jgi:hypothetical protein